MGKKTAFILILIGVMVILAMPGVAVMTSACLSWEAAAAAA